MTEEIMEDHEIIELYVNRDENAIRETQNKYGAFCTGIALGLLHIKEDAQECVNDTYMAAWNRIPPLIPECLKAFLGRVTRNIAISMYRRKRCESMELMLSELGECLPARENTENSVDAKQLGEYISEWADTLAEQDRMIFVRRYWYADKSYELARKTGMSASGMSRKLSRLRKSLRKYLTERGVEI